MPHLQVNKIIQKNIQSTNHIIVVALSYFILCGRSLFRLYFCQCRFEIHAVLENPGLYSPFVMSSSILRFNLQNFDSPLRP